MAEFEIFKYVTVNLLTLPGSFFLALALPLSFLICRHKNSEVDKSFNLILIIFLSYLDCFITINAIFNILINFFSYGIIVP